MFEIWGIERKRVMRSDNSLVPAKVGSPWPEIFSLALGLKEAVIMSLTALTIWVLVIAGMPGLWLKKSL